MKADLPEIKSVNDFLDWKSTPGDDVEDINEKYADSLGWINTDVMYSFLGIYALGVWVYNADKFKVTDYYIFVKGTNQSIYSEKFIRNIQNDSSYNLSELNGEIESLINVYFSVGNVMPIWPGGNKEKGVTKGCFDLPELFFARYYNWYLALRRIYRGTLFLDGFIKKGTPKLKRYSCLREFLKTIDTPEKYKKFLYTVCNNIKNREADILEWIVTKNLMELNQ